jgi:hypothetical protein
VARHHLSSLNDLLTQLSSRDAIACRLQIHALESCSIYGSNTNNSSLLEQSSQKFSSAL